MQLFDMQGGVHLDEAHGELRKCMYAMLLAGKGAGVVTEYLWDGNSLKSVQSSKSTAGSS